MAAFRAKAAFPYLEVVVRGGFSPGREPGSGKGRRMKRLRRSVRIAAVLSAAAVSFATNASAIAISGLTITNTGTADGKTDTLTNYNENRSSTTILDSGGSAADTIGSSVNAATRYAAITVADAGIYTTASRNATHSYTISFTVSAGAGIGYDVKIDTSRLGALTRVDDGSVGASASIGGVVGTLNAVTNASLALSAVSLPSGNSAANTPFSQTSSTLTIFGLTGTHVITLGFSWSSSVSSSSGLTGGDEVAVRLGMTGTGGGTPGTTADDYPGVGGRTQANDGHFVNVTAIVTVPEPGTAFLIGTGLAGLALRGRRRA